MTPTPEQVADWAREADCLHMYYIHPPAMERLAALVADWQRERDAKIVEKHQGWASRSEIAKAIRSDCAEPGKAG